MKVELNAELKETNKLLERIARAMETFNLHTFGTTGDVDTTGDPATVEYSDDLGTLRQEVETFMGKNREE